MRLPELPRRMADMAEFCRQSVAWMRANEIRNVQGGKVHKSTSGTTLEFKPGKSVGPGGAAAVILPFEISVTADSLIAAAGTIYNDSHAQEVNTTMTNGTWYFRAKVVINSSTGAITSTDVLWATSEAANTSTDFYLTIGQVDVVTGVPDPLTIVQYTYGPMLVVQYGTPTDKWGVTIF